MGSKNQKPILALTHSPFVKPTKVELSQVAQVQDLKKIKKSDYKNVVATFGLLTHKVDQKFLDRFPNLQAVANYAVGIDNIDEKECKKRNIKIINTPDVLTRSTAECALTLLLSTARRVFEGEQMCRSGKFQGWKPDLLLGVELKNKNAVLVGKGRIGFETKKLFEALSIQTEWITKKDSKSSIEKKLKKADILSFHIPYRKENHHWLDSKKISILKKSCIVINTARGAIIDEKALIQALEKKKILGAGLDVFEFEPKIPKKLRSLKNVTLLPHLGSATFEARQAMLDHVLKKLYPILKRAKIS